MDSFAEDFPTNSGPFDLTVAAASIHWMDHSRLFPHLLANAAPGHVMAVISGDGPFEPPWQSDWHSFLGKWVPEVTGQPFDHDKRSEGMRSYESYLNLCGSEHFVSERPFEQSVADFVSCQHSRDTFAPSKLGDRIASFDAELSELLRAYSNGDRLSFVVRTRIVWGEIKPIRQETLLGSRQRRRGSRADHLSSVIPETNIGMTEERRAAVRVSPSDWE